MTTPAAAANSAPPAKPSGAEQKADRIRDQVLALDVKRVADWIASVVRSIKASRTYPANSPTLHKFQVELESQTWSCLKEVGDITLTIQQFDLLFENYSVYHNADRNESLAFRFYGDGVREIIFREGLEPHELRGFLEVLRRAVESAQVQDDVVTLLWERDFRHVEYSFIPLEDLTDEPARSSKDGEDEDGEEGGIPWPVRDEAAVEPVPPAEDGPISERSDDWAPRVDTAPAWDETVGVQFTLSEEENLALGVTIRDEEGRALAHEVLEIVATILASETTPAGFLESAAAFQRFVELAIEEGNIARANGLIAHLRTIAARKAAENAEFQGLAEQVIREIGRPSFLGQMAPTLNAHSNVDPAILTNFLVQLGSSAAPAICDLLGQVNHIKYRRALCESLAISCKNDVDVLIERLNDPRWYVIRNIVFILGRIAHQGVERALDRALHHEDVRVRKEAVRALGNIQSPTSRAYLISSFRDPDSGVRMQAATTLSMHRDERSAQSIFDVTQSPEFSRRDTNERQAYFEALGRCGSDSLLPKLVSMLTRGGLFRTVNEEERLHAALALAWLGTPASLEVLNREMKNKRESVRKAVETALGMMRTAAYAHSRAKAAEGDDNE